KTLDGTMCPSYMVTREEAHSTRGRANVLRLAMAGRLGESGLGDQGVHDVLDLCLECRACKAECPVGVDMARFKSEFLADYHTRHGSPLSARVLGHVHEMARLGSRLAPISNWAVGAPAVRWLNERLLGLDRRRIPPPWSRRTLGDLFARRRAKTPSSPRAVLFGDTFTNYYSPQIGLAAADLIEASGLTIAVAPTLCCGRPLISQGLLAEARDRVARNTSALYSLGADGQSLVFLEPSCLSAFKEDAPALLRGDLQRQALSIADRCQLFEECLEQQMEAHPRALTFAAGPETILLHGHCHQKSMGMLLPTRALLSRIPGATVVDLDAGCCGMAGSFGYMRDHFEVSRQIAERKLLPAARRQRPGSVMVAPGTSCRAQVQDLAGVRALHPAELLRSLMSEPS
ncbi:MAG: FAD-binding oxidoreductase, partial [Luteitalea sp.]|nr:FAD-binding oxidoreductase [Luteitalea sp.]